METILEIKSEGSPAIQALAKERVTPNSTSDYNPGTKNKLSIDQLTTNSLPGVLCMGIQYYDLRNVFYINNTGIANLIDLLKSLLKKGIEVQFVNVNEKIKKKVKAIGLEGVINCT